MKLPTIDFLFIPFHIIRTEGILLENIPCPAQIRRCLCRMIAPAVPVCLKVLHRVADFNFSVFPAILFSADPDQRFRRHCLRSFRVLRISVQCKKVGPHFRKLCDHSIIIIHIPPVRPLRKIMERMNPSYFKGRSFHDILPQTPNIDLWHFVGKRIPMKIKSYSQTLKISIHRIQYGNTRLTCKNNPSFIE